jgi:hypothetical protein
LLVRGRRRRACDSHCFPCQQAPTGSNCKCGNCCIIHQEPIIREPQPPWLGHSIPGFLELVPDPLSKSSLVLKMAPTYLCCLLPLACPPPSPQQPRLHHVPLLSLNMTRSQNHMQVQEVDCPQGESSCSTLSYFLGLEMAKFFLLLLGTRGERGVHSGGGGGRRGKDRTGPAGCTRPAAPLVKPCAHTWKVRTQFCHRLGG